MSTAIVASRINTDKVCRSHNIKAIDFDIWHMPNIGGRHEVHVLYCGGFPYRGFIGKGDTFTKALDDLMDQLRQAIDPNA